MFSRGCILEFINETQVVLTPKIKRPNDMGQFRSISYCNFVFKVITRIIVARLRCFLDAIITSNYSALISGKLIQDNIAIAYEVFHWLKKRSGKGKDS